MRLPGLVRVARGMLAATVAGWLVVSGTTNAQQFGWERLSDTRLRSVCPPENFGGESYDFSYYCRNVTAAWSGGAFDTRRNRLYLWGGGHHDYYGNEVYALDLTSGSMLRITDPAVPTADRNHPTNAVRP